MRHYISISIATLVAATVLYLLVDYVSDDSRAAIGTLTITGLVSLILYSAYHSSELKRGS
jgi:hypothetical protein